MMDSFDRLPAGFRVAKPIRHIDVKEATLRDRRREWIIQRKRDGERAYALIGDKPRIFSRGLEDLSAHVPHLIEQLASLRFPYGTMFDGELVASKETDDFHAVSSLCRSSATKATLRGLKLGFCGFDVLFLNRIKVWQLPYKDRFNTLSILPRIGAQFTRTPNLWYAPHVNRPLQACRELAHDERWEGLILWDKTSATSVKTGTVQHPPDRIGCYKLKEYRDADFVATGYEIGCGHDVGQMSALNLAQYVKDGSQLVLQPCGKVGTGFTHQQRAEAVTWSYPLCVEVRYDSQEESGHLRCPVFTRLRPDVLPAECIRDEPIVEVENELHGDDE